MSSTTYKVIAYYATGEIHVHPSGGKCLSKKDAQRAADAMLKSEQPFKTCDVVEVVMTLSSTKALQSGFGQLP